MAQKKKVLYIILPYEVLIQPSGNIDYPAKHFLKLNEKYPPFCIYISTTLDIYGYRGEYIWLPR
ncbi:hypothetical protein HMPREF1981_02967 [Bacteroides pyogenes F0041]|uniref:Uncharacterized protein n=1 Tax=Bacteroides pyogenes F0041 TaxID=1321819 RepID=U2DQ10_9BACE|nr:hypothetical protein HMPREF1981_02967 [Bacteroides pyogenes F0041]